MLDTNALVSALLSPHGSPRRLLDGARAQVFDLCSSQVLIAELFDVVSRKKFSERFAQAGLTPLAIVAEIRRMSSMVVPARVPSVIRDDPDDDHVLACALAGNADLIVSGDAHVLGLGREYEGIRIVTPAEAIQMIGR